MLRICALFVLCLLPVAPAAQAGFSGPVRVIDADTWDVGERRVRLHGIDAPELDQTCRDPAGPVWGCGLWASNEARRRYEGRQAECEAVETDRYGRTVARCAVNGEDAGRFLVSQGIAFAYRRYSLDYDLDEKGAAIDGRGLHRTQVQSPAQFRRSRSPDTPPASHDCRIKGNISGKGARIYHMPGQRDYLRTRISPERGERWFCTEIQAKAAGWRRARR
ncbi:MAG: thermonuclease family protein [Jhaorihella sp.]